MTAKRKHKPDSTPGPTLIVDTEVFGEHSLPTLHMELATAKIDRKTWSVSLALNGSALYLFPNGKDRRIRCLPLMPLINQWIEKTLEEQKEISHE